MPTQSESGQEYQKEGARGWRDRESEQEHPTPLEIHAKSLSWIQWSRVDSREHTRKLKDAQWC